MVTERCLRVLLLSVLQTTWNYVEGIDANLTSGHLNLKNATSIFIVPSVLYSTTHPSQLTDQTTAETTKSGSDTPSLRFLRSHFTSNLNTLSNLNSTMLNAQTYASSEEVGLNTSLQVGGATSSHSETGTSWANTVTLVEEKTPHESLVSHGTLSTSEIQRSTQNLTHSYLSSGFTAQVRQSLPLGKARSSVSFSSLTTRTEMFFQLSSITDPEPTTVSHSKTDGLVLSSVNPGNNESYRINSNTPTKHSWTKQTQSTSSKITTLPQEFMTASSYFSVHGRNDTSQYFRTTYPGNFASFISSLTSTDIVRYGRSSVVATSSYISKNEYSSSMFSGSRDRTAVYATPAITSQINPRTTSHEVEITRSIASRTAVSSFAGTTTVLSGGTSSRRDVMPTKSILPMSVMSLMTQQSRSVKSSEETKLQVTPPDRCSSNHTMKPTTILVNAVNHTPSCPEERQNLPYYVLAICLPLTLLFGMMFTFIYIRRSKLEQRTRYSVTVEISSEKPDYEMKRMYSIIDVSDGNINKDFWPGLDSENSSSSIMDLTLSKSAK